MSWKQPIPTNLDEVFGTDYICLNLYVHLLLRSANQDGFFTDDKTKRTFQIKRGDVVFGRNAWARRLLTSPASIERALHKLTEIYQKVSYLTSQGFTIVSIKDYDKVCDMSEWRASGERVVSTSKIIKNNKEDSKEVPKRKISTRGDLRGDVKPLDYQHIYDIAVETFLSIEDVRLIERQVILSIKDGNPYHIKNQVNAVKKWCYNALGRKKLETRNDTENMLFKFESPEEIAKSKKSDELLKVKYPNLF